MRATIVNAVVLALLPAEGTRPAKPAEPAPTAGDLPIGLCLVPEMGYIPEVDSWQRDVAPHADHVRLVRRQWQKQAVSLQKHLTPRLARRLSRWARKEMAAYAKVPRLGDVELKPVRANPQHRKGVYEGTIDTLPTHSRVVTRWLKVYVLYDETNRTILRTTITIRGERLE